MRDGSGTSDSPMRTREGSTSVIVTSPPAGSRRAASGTLVRVPSIYGELVAAGASARGFDLGSSGLRMCLARLWQVATAEERADAAADVVAYLLDRQNQADLESQAPRLISILANCPFAEVAAELEHLPLARERLAVSKSRFFADRVLVAVTGEPLLQQAFLATGIVTPLDRVLVWQPRYAEAFYASFDVLLREPGPLPFDVRAYVLLLVGAQTRHRGFLRRGETEFLLLGGDPEWLQGIAHAPPRIREFARLDALLATQPWMLTSERLEPLLSGPHSWSVGELIHAICLAVSVRAVACTSHGCGLNFGAESGLNLATELLRESNVDLPLLEEDALISDEPVAASHDSTIAMLEVLKRDDGADAESEVPAESSARLELFEAAETDFDTLPGSDPITAGGDGVSSASPSSSASSLKANEEAFRTNHQSPHRSSVLLATDVEVADFVRFEPQPSAPITDFDVRSKEYSVFRESDWNWADQGFAVISRFFPRLAPLLDTEFSVARTMTDRTFSSFAEVDTTPFRIAVWQYVQRVKGILHDGYNYKNINVYMNKFSKAFIKKLVVTPQAIRYADFQNLGYDLLPHEKFHACVIATESRKQAELLYSLSCIARFRRLTA